MKNINQLPSRSPKIGLVSLGCPKALVDSEKILTSLTHNGYKINKDHRNADLVIVNTCGFIDSAKEESINTISSSLNENGKVIITGCLGRDKTTIKKFEIQSLSINEFLEKEVKNNIIDFLSIDLPFFSILNLRHVLSQFYLMVF